MKPYEITTITLPDDYEGPAAAKLIAARAGAGPSHKAVLYLHGYMDYFFQDHMARYFADAGYNFYALEIRKYGRAILPHQHPYYIRSLYEYYPEIDRAIEIISGAGNSFIGMIGHSTGGLLAALYTDDGKERGRIDRVALNSPFLEFNTSWFNRGIVLPLASLVGKLFPYARARSKISSHYIESIHRSMRGEWDFDLTLKPEKGVPLYLAWLGAVRQGHRRVKRGLSIGVPVLVLHSDRSVRGKQWSEEFRTGDAVLDVAHIRKYAPRLGSRVTIVEIREGMHDLILSRADVRERALRLMLDFMDAQ